LLNFHLGKSFEEEDDGYWDAFSMQFNPSSSIKLPQEEKKKSLGQVSWVEEKLGPRFAQGPWLLPRGNCWDVARP
jgi:hypothetical protein